MSESLDTLSAELGNRLAARDLLLATAESCTGGWIAKVITDIPGSSRWLDRGFVAYSNAAKEDLLGVPATLINEHGAVSEPVAAAMAAGAKTRSRAQVTVAVTGIAGPDGGTPEKPVGTVWFAWGLPDGTVKTQRVQFAGNREEVRHQTVRLALTRLLELVP